MGAMASQITSLTIVCSTVYSGADQRKHQSSMSPAFVWGIHQWPVNSPHKGPVCGKCFHFMTLSCRTTMILFVHTTGFTIRDTFHERFFHRNSDSVADLLCSHPHLCEAFVMAHGTTAVVVYTKFCSCVLLHNGITLKQISIEFELWWKIVRKMGPRITFICDMVDAYRWFCHPDRSYLSNLRGTGTN